jgi:hypothetical protein
MEQNTKDAQLLTKASFQAIAGARNLPSGLRNEY